VPYDVVATVVHLFATTIHRIGTTIHLFGTRLGVGMVRLPAILSYLNPAGSAGLNEWIHFIFISHKL
jgi:hypothetical protein